TILKIINLSLLLDYISLFLRANQFMPLPNLRISVILHCRFSSMYQAQNVKEYCCLWHSAVSVVRSTIS
ncbi:MAG: hypothetical protein KAX38_01080, partial [Candidatus Krumholzibacteria bacterium]|nr:hypothetical protein [Candidatus Krumholzibacteria bacterium]